MRYLLTLCFLLVATTAYAQEANDNVLVTDSTSNSTVTTDSTTTINSPPPSAISPGINNSNSDLCTIGVSGAVQTQILGISTGMTFTEENCLRLKNAKTMYDMGMKVAAVSIMCQDPDVFQAMLNAGTPCPYNGMVGDAARMGWEADPEARPDAPRQPRMNATQILGDMDESTKSTAIGAGVIGLLLLLLL